MTAKTKRSKTTQNQPRTKGKPIDWPALRARFMRYDGSLRSFAKTESVSWSPFATRAAAEKWCDEREKFRAGVAAEVVAKSAAQAVSVELEINAKAHALAMKVLEIAAGLIDGVDDVRDLESVINAATKARREARITALLTEDPTPKGAGEDATSGDVTIRRRRPDGTFAEVTFASRPQRLHADGDAKPVP